MDANAERFLEESRGLDSEPPFSMTTAEAAAFARGREEADVFKAAMVDAVRGCANLQSIVDNQRAVIGQQANELNRLAQENYEFRQRLLDLYDDNAYDDPALD